MTATLPPEYEFGFVTGKIIHAVGDRSEDVDRLPEARVPVGTVKFSPLVKTRKASDAIVLHEQVVCTIGPGGFIQDAEGLPGVWLIAGPYRVDFAIAGGSYESFSITVTAEHTKDAPYDIGAQSPVQPSPGTPMTVLEVPSGAFEGGVVGWQNGAPAWVPNQYSAVPSPDHDDAIRITYPAHMSPAPFVVRLPIGASQ